MMCPMEISPNYSTDDWHGLNLVDPIANADHWEKAINVFEDRISGRFLKIVENIQKLPYSGFVVMALDCLLIETLEQFYRGVPDSVGGSQLFFTHFFERSDVLKNEFTVDQRKLFYEQFRCGILHQDEIKGDSLVRKVGPLVRDNSGNGITINREKFHEILVCEFNNYTKILRGQNPVCVDLRLKFRAKMDYICRKPQYYFAFRADITDQVLQMRLGQVRVIDRATLIGWKVKTNRKGGWIGIEPDNNSNIAGSVYQLSVNQLDSLPEFFEKDNKPIPIQVNCPAIPQSQMVWVYSR